MTERRIDRPFVGSRRSSLLVLLVALAAVVTSSPAPTGAQASGGTISLGGISDGVEVRVTGWQGTTTASVGTAPSWILECTAREGGEIQVSEIDPGNPYVVPNFAEGETGWGYVLCPINDVTMAVNPLIEYSGIMSYWPIGDPVPAEVVAYVLQTSLAQLRVPATTGTSAPIGEAGAPMIAQLPTWLWIDAADWQPRSATAGPVFGVQATATATPIAVGWTGGDDGPIDCGANAGPVYDFSKRDDLQHSDCTTRFEHSSAVADTTLATTVTWRVTASCSVPCGPSDVGDLVVTTVRPVEVAELLAVGTADSRSSDQGASS